MLTRGTADEANPPRCYVSIESAGVFLGTSEKTVRRMISRGELPAYRLGPRQIRIKRADLESLLRPIPASRNVG